LTEEGYYHKKKFSLYKDYINFYIKNIYSHNLLDTITTQQDKFDSYQLKRHHKCFILFAETENVTEEDLKVLEETQHAAIIFSLPNMISDVKMVVLIDTTKQCAYCVPPGKNNYSSYKAGYNLIKKYLIRK
ncbi:MAG: hypothetical protein K2J93_03590, partial [Anaeroplasmataceae bacterium]|nr:hypothetical protein [Anaeroplasmataceae bacterium]